MATLTTLPLLPPKMRLSRIPMLPSGRRPTVLLLMIWLVLLGLLGLLGLLVGRGGIRTGHTLRRAIGRKATLSGLRRRRSALLMLLMMSRISMLLRDAPAAGVGLHVGWGRAAVLSWRGRAVRRRGAVALRWGRGGVALLVGWRVLMLTSGRL